MSKRLKEKLRSLKPKRILDVATGKGGFIEFVLQTCMNCKSIVGVDISHATLAAARKRTANSAASYVAMRGEQLAFADNTFDVVCISNSLHHLTNPEITLAEMKRVLKPDGTFIITEMFKDNQSQTQMTHIMLHHWWADIDTAQGKTHNRTLSRQQLIGLACQLNLADLDSFDIAASASDPHDPARIRELEDVCESYFSRLLTDNGYSQLINRGNELRKRLRNTGVDWATEVCIMGRKKTAMIENFEVP
jgi:2-polyprenyl-3-methyl-5-hydroxy-6-metoxy-1,4-benzoquinol methylase